MDLIRHLTATARMLAEFFGVGLKCGLFAFLAAIVGAGVAAGDDRAVPLTLEVRPSTPGLVKWVEKIGAEGGTPVVSNDLVIIGTDNGHPRVQAQREDAGAIMCFDRKTGRFRWQMLHTRLPDPASDMRNALFTEPVIAGDRVYYQNNRGEAVCVALDNDNQNKSAKLIWKFDFLGRLGVFKRDSIVNPVPTPLLDDGRLYCVTGNGSIHGCERKPESGAYVPRPDAPSFVALDAKTGKVLWTNSAPGKSICYGQWGSPAKLVIGKTTAILFPGGDGYLYALAPDTGRILAKVNLNPASVKPWGDFGRGDVAFCSQRPLVVDKSIYVGLGQDQDMPIGKRFPIMCIDGEELLAGSPRERAIRWEFRNDEFDGMLGEMAVAGNRLYAISRTGCVVCLDRQRGHLNWLVLHEGSTRFPGIAIHGGRVYVPTDDSVWVYADADAPRALLRYKFEHMPMCTPAVTDNELFVTTSSRLWCLQLRK